VHGRKMYGIIRKRDKMNKKMVEDKNGYVYPYENGYKVYWKKEELKPAVDIVFSYFNEAYFYLRSVC